MREVETGDPDLLEWRGGGGCLMLFGFPFLAMGILAMIMPRFKSPEGDEPSVAFVMIFGLIFASVGAGLMFGRRGVTLDRRRRLAESWWGLILPLRRKMHTLEEFERVELSKEIRRSKDSTYTVYPVRLQGSAKLSLGEMRDLLKSRGKGEKVAKFLNLPLRDTSSGEAVERVASQLDESLRDRVKRTGESVEVPAPPLAMKTEVSLEGEATVLEIPSAGFTPQLLVLAIVGFFFLPVVFAFIVAPFVAAGKEKGALFPILIGAGIAMLVVAVVVVMAVLKKARRRERVIVTRGSIRLEPRGIEIPSEELEELKWQPVPANVPSFFRGLVRGAGIIARSDRAEIRFGGHLPEGELRHLHGLIKSILAS